MPYKVLQVIDKLDVGGAEKITVLLANILVNKGHDISVLTITDTGELSGNLCPKVKQINLSRRSKWDISSAINFMKIANNYDLIHIHLRHNLKWVLFWSIILRKRFNIIFHDHGNVILEWNLLFSINISKLSHIMVNRKLCKSQPLIHSFSPKVYFLENIIDQVPAKGNYHKNKDQYSLVIVSNLRKSKNIQFAINLASYLAQDNKIILDLYFTHFNKEYLKGLQELSKNTNSQLEVNFIEGIIEPQLYFNKYDLALNPSVNESGPLNVLEYLAHGLPFISYNSGQSIILVEEKFPEFIINSFIIEKWVSRLKMVLERGRFYYMSSMQKLYNQNYSSEDYLVKCLKIYKKNLN